MEAAAVIMKIEAVCSSETSWNLCWITEPYIPEAVRVLIGPCESF
jgi:hypothetical protein